jgi:hypothetical protein
VPDLDWNIEACLQTLNLMKEHIPEPWSVTSSNSIHLEATERMGAAHRRIFLPYGLIEGEPTFPLTNYTPGPMAEHLSQYSAAVYPRGVMANAQTHCLQLPHTYLFAHFAQGGTASALDVEGFADQVIPGSGAVVARAWQEVESGDAAAQRNAARAVRQETGKPHRAGKSSGLLFGNADRFLNDLAMNLEVRAALTDLKAAINDAGAALGAKPAGVRLALKQALLHLRPYQQRLGFVDAYGGPLYTALNEPVARLNDPAIGAILFQFHNWRDPSVRNGILPRLLDALEAYAGG